MPQFIYTMKGLGKVHPPDQVVLKDIWLSFLPGAKIGVLGLNGAGKSTLLRDHGGRGSGVSSARRFRPTASASASCTRSRDSIPRRPCSATSRRACRRFARCSTRYDEINAKLGEDLSPEEMDKVLEEQGKVQDRIESAERAGSSTRGSNRRWTRCGCRRADADVATLSGGERRRVALCRLLLQRPDLLLLDEPTNHLDAESVAWLEHFLKEYPGTVVAVTHDRYFLDNVAGWILELDRGPAFRGKATTRPGSSRSRTGSRIEEKAETKRQRTLQRELEWIRMSPRARQAKGKARLNAYEELLSEDTAQKIEQVEIYIPPGPRLGDIVVEARGLRKAYGDMLLMDDVNFTLPRGGIVGVIGPNGAGKTTLFRMITGQEQPDGGTLRLGETVQVGYVDQSRDALAAEQERLGGDHRRRRRGRDRASATVASRAYVSWFNFKGRDQQRKVGRALGRRAQPRAPGQAAARPAATCCCSTSRPTTSTSTRSARSKRRCSTSPAAPSSSATIAGSSTASPRTCWPSKATARSCGSRATIRTTRSTASAASAPKRTSRTESSTGS